MLRVWVRNAIAVAVRMSQVDGGIFRWLDVIVVVVVRITYNMTMCRFGVHVCVCVRVCLPVAQTCSLTGAV